MKKQLTTSILTLSLAAALVLPATAQAKGFNPGEALVSIKDRVAGSAQRLYLRALPGSKDGRAVLKQSTMAMENVSSFRYDVSMEGSVDKDGESLGQVKLTMGGPVQSNGIYDTDAKQQLTVTGEFQVEGVQVTGAGEMIVDGQDTAYLKLTEIPLPLEQYRDLKNQWIKMDMAKMRENSNQAEISPEVMRRYRQAMEKLYDESTITQAKKEKWEDEPVFVLEMEVGTDAIMNYLEEVMSIMNDVAEEPKPATMTQEDKTQMRKLLTAMGPFKGTLRIDRKTFYLRQSEMTLVVDANKIQKAMQTGEYNNDPAAAFDKMTLNIKGEFSDFNQPVEITIPTDAKSIEEVMQEVMGVSGMGAYNSTAYPDSSNIGDTQGGYPGDGEEYDLPSDLTPEEIELMKQYGY